ncbi:MAG: hypothetical protein ACTSQP_16260 [Promethearchaeota archaeon]
MSSLFTEFKIFMENISQFAEKIKKSGKNLDFNLKANILLSDLKRNNSFIIYISENKKIVQKGFSTSIGFTLIGSSSIWRDVIKGTRSLIGAFTEGSIKVPNIRVNWFRLNKFSNLIKILKNEV